MLTASTFLFWVLQDFPCNCSEGIDKSPYVVAASRLRR